MGMMTSVLSCIEKMGFATSGEKLFEVYSNCSTIVSNGKITNYQTVRDVGACFLKHYSPLSRYLSETCIPEQYRSTFITCMENTKENFLPSVSNIYKKATLFFNDNTLGLAFEADVKKCSLQSIAAKVEDTVKFDQSHSAPQFSQSPLYLAVSIAVLSFTGLVLWKYCNRWHRKQS